MKTIARLLGGGWQSEQKMMNIYDFERDLAGVGYESCRLKGSVTGVSCCCHSNTIRCSLRSWRNIVERARPTRGNGGGAADSGGKAARFQSGSFLFFSRLRRPYSLSTVKILPRTRTIPPATQANTMWIELHSCVDTFLLDHVVVLAPDLISLLRGLCCIFVFW